jgi:hypothetical protein
MDRYISLDYAGVLDGKGLLDVQGFALQEFQNVGAVTGGDIDGDHFELADPLLVDEQAQVDLVA